MGIGKTQTPVRRGDEEPPFFLYFCALVFLYVSLGVISRTMRYHTLSNLFVNLSRHGVGHTNFRSFNFVFSFCK